MLPVVDPSVALRWLGLARRAFLVSQATFVLLAFAADPDVPVVPWLVGLGAVGALDLVARRGRDFVAVRRHAALDLGGMTLVLFLSGGPQNPVGSFLLVELALLAVVLPAADAWIATGATLVLQAATVFLPTPLHGFDESPHEHPSHLLGHMLAFDVAAVAITALVGRLSATLREREQALRDAALRHAEHERLAALGTLAAGTAHALGTPLGAIELLAEEMALDLPDGSPGREAWATLRGELGRSRDILDRLLSEDTGVGGITPHLADALAAWAGAWQRSHGRIRLALALDDRLGDTTVRGVEAGWREALWTVLDNAARAGGEEGAVRVTARRLTDTAVVEVVDDGPPADVDALARAGQPFHSGWPGTPGRGLGLYVARRFARGAGGDLSLAAVQPRGVRATLTLPVEGR